MDANGARVRVVTAREDASPAMHTRRRVLTIAAVQMECSEDYQANMNQAKALISLAKHEHGAQVVLLPELFCMRYFPQVADEKNFARAETYEECAALHVLCQVAKDLDVVLPCSFFEKCNNAHFNSVCVIDATGERLGIYRKSHIPTGPGYEEKFYFSPGNTGFKVFDTKHARIGVGICWDQWFPEAARAMVLRGAEVLLYPTAIGSEPQDPSLHSFAHWKRVMKGHAAANMVPVIAANRVGTEPCEGSSHRPVTFYGGSFATDARGKTVACAPLEGSALVVSSVDLEASERARCGWGLFRDRRPDMYTTLLALDGTGTI